MTRRSVRRRLTAAAALALLPLLAACAGQPMIALLGGTQSPSDRMPIYLGVAEAPSGPDASGRYGLDIDSTRFLAEHEGNLLYVGLSYDPRDSESICLLSEPADEIVRHTLHEAEFGTTGRIGFTMATVACGGVRDAPLWGVYDGNEYMLLRDGAPTGGAVDAGWTRLHANLWVRPYLTQ
ncbi:hypothetical protein [Compostimonas suwonensis]|uniref:Lipoprotein n=1 Tax=Compostimonas suwonensis TaxID=1048394 RepID=A0A2M9C4F3_9MICO|nr:hypothetical protein [Compostimonas suwonensis]PJJ65403.1 hypothetical protein CLV54_0436 [Compostimonas suwonensis]